ncbi:MAG: endonuclease/exonuclease/phosphatase family protein [Gammaproteobacteria bacterium]|nr:endonuclease/exonuclease/phosphatase family protein [Gammaproteobacteria bacterium]MBT8150604.1 endonuclease/exonuclease/phosphatase family protein [Gammaproteobacteria bacterium]NND38404.1 endonuclease [Pseudomonadales bacterium]
MTIIFSALTFLLTAATAIPILRHEGWWVRGFDFPRMQFAVLALVLLVLEFFMLPLSDAWTWPLILITALCLAYQAWWVLPYTAVFPVEVHRARQKDQEKSIKIMTANVLTPNRNAASLISLVKAQRPDVLVTLESDSWWEEQLKELETIFVYTIKCPLDNLYGMHVYSKLPLSNESIEFLVEEDVPSIHTEVQLRCGQIVRMHFLHPAPPSPTENEESSERDAELLVVAKSVAEAVRPVIVTGDLNDVAWSHTTRLFRKISGLLDPRIGRGMFNTFHADYFFLRWPLDHLFHSDHFSLESIKRLPSFGSDHFALVTELYFEPGRAPEQEGIESTADDRAHATGKTRSEGVKLSDVPVPAQDDSN